MSYQYNIIYTAGGKVHKTHHSETVDFEIREEINGDILALTLLPKTDITFQKFEIKDNISFSKDIKAGLFQKSMHRMTICVMILIQNFCLF